MNMTTAATRDRRLSAVQGVQSLQRATALLQLLAAHQAAGLPLHEIITLSGLDRTTTYRILSGLAASGMVQRDIAAPRHYRLGIEAMALGIAAMRRAPLVDICAPLMKTLARRAGESVFLVVRSVDHSHCLHLEEGARPVKGFALHVGSTRLLGLGVASLALLAQLSDGELRTHHARHQLEYGTHDVSVLNLQQWAERTRQLGYSRGSADGVAGVGLRFAVGSCADAALSIIAPVSRMPRSRGQELVTAMRGALAGVVAQLQP